MPMARLKERFAVGVNYLDRIRHIFARHAALVVVSLGQCILYSFIELGMRST